MCSNCRFPGKPWEGKLSRSGLEAACEELGIKMPLRITRGGQAKGANATYRAAQSYAEGRHVINMSRDLSAGAANLSLLHELTHAAQYERHGPHKADLLYKLGDMLRGYRDNPQEIEARETADRLCDRFKVVVR